MGQKGIAMISVILLLLIVIVLLNALMSMTVTEVKISMNDQYAAQAFYLAEAGNEIALDYLYDNPNFRGQLLNLPAYEKPTLLGNGKINSILIENNLSNVRITSEGDINGIRKKISLLVKINVMEHEEITQISIDRLRWQYSF